MQIKFISSLILGEVAVIRSTRDVKCSKKGRIKAWREIRLKYFMKEQLDEASGDLRSVAGEMFQR